jgi:nucleoside-diphosphate-sugar epimerase
MSKLHLVTGATGQLGSHIVEQLRAAGEQVRVLVRPGRDTTFLRNQGAEIIEGDLREVAAVRRTVAGAEVVYHCAARVSDWGSWADFAEETVACTRHLVEACRAEQTPRLLHVSSVSVYGNPRLPPGTPITEETPLGQRLGRWDHYPRSKLLAEQLAREYAASTVVRPSWIYGPRDRVTTPRVVTGLLQRRVPILGSGQNKLNIIYAGDVAAGTILAAQHPQAIGRVYNLSSQGEVSQLDLLNALTDALALPRLHRHIPFWLVNRVASVQELCARLLRRSRPPTITRRAVYLIGRSTLFSTTRARTELGWMPQVNVREGVRRTLAWYSSLPENGALRRQMPAFAGQPDNEGDSAATS